MSRFGRKNLFDWFGSNQGRQFTFTGISTLAIGSSVAYFLTHTFLLEKYKEIVQMYGYVANHSWRSEMIINIGHFSLS